MQLVQTQCLRHNYNYGYHSTDWRVTTPPLLWCLKTYKKDDLRVGPTKDKPSCSEAGRTQKLVETLFSPFSMNFCLKSRKNTRKKLCFKLLLEVGRHAKKTSEQPVFYSIWKISGGAIVSLSFLYFSILTPILDDSICSHYKSNHVNLSE